LYQVIAESHGARVVHYDLLPEQGWQVDLDHIDRIISEEEAKTNNDTNNIKVVRGIVVNNPSNPTGAVYSEEHLSQIIRLAEKWNVPIVSDEIYGDLTFGSNVFHPMANVAAKLDYSVPVITASGLGKQYLVPGWRLGWIIFQDSRHGSIQEVKKGAQRLAQVVLGASRLAQVAIPAVLNPSNESDIASIAQWKANLHSQVENQAALLCGLLDKCHGLEVIRPQGAMYAMVRIHVHLFDDDIHDDVSFMKLLLEEENIVVLPGQAFGLDKEDHDTTPVFRVVFCAPEDVLVCACERISTFCGRHAL
jgi:tyrosine aminotransferase